jgi:hypothetical protein
MNTQEIKYQLFKEIDKIDDDKLLSELLSLLKSEKEDEANFWAMLSEEQKSEIETAARENSNPQILISEKKLHSRILKSANKK